MRMLSDALLDALQAQDTPHGDLTTEALGIDALPGRISFAARQAMTLACAEEAARLLARAGARPDLIRPSGTVLDAGAVFLTAEGPAGALHRAWKVAQTLVEYASGIATRTRAIVSAAGGIPVACTRKNFPGTKEIAIRAIRAGGARMHRLGLSETILVFAEHRVFLPGAEGEALARLRGTEPERRILVEVATPAEALAAAGAGADGVQLEKFSPDAVAEVVRGLAGTRVLVLAAGGITAANAAAYAATGCDLLVTSAPYFAPPADVQVRIAPLAP